MKQEHPSRSLEVGPAVTRERETEALRIIDRDLRRNEGDLVDFVTRSLAEAPTPDSVLQITR